MQRILIIGIMASGKSTFAQKLGTQLNLPVHHLDKYYWKPGWVRPNSQAEWLDTIHQLINQDQWIIEGNYGNTLPLRMTRADTVIIFNYPKWLCLYRAFKRLYTSRHNPFDKAEGLQERISFKLIKQILTYNVNETIRKVKKHQTNQKTIIVHCDQEAQKLLSQPN